MASPFVRIDLPEPPANLPREVRDYLKLLIDAHRKQQVETLKSMSAQETYASLKVLGVAPERYQNGDEFEVDATVGAAAPFGSGAGKYVVRGGVMVFIG